LLIGEAAAPEIVDDIKALIADQPAIVALNEIRTLHRGPNDVLLALSVDYNDEIPAGMVERTNTDLEKLIKERYPVVKRLFIEVQSADHHAEELARAEELRQAGD